jgi:hypothetical protein
MRLFLSSFLLVAGITSLRAEVAEDDGRSLSMEHNMFETLECNLIPVALENASCSSWKTKFGTMESHANEVVVPCGECYTMDVDGPQLSLLGGLDIQGKLQFLDGYQVNIETPYVRVQGELHLTSTKPWDGTQDVTITLTGTNTELPKFVPANTNMMKCGMSGAKCTTGKKPFIVAGGKLIINGLPSLDTPTWVHLYDIGSSYTGPETLPSFEAYPGPENLDECSQDGVFIYEDFTEPNRFNTHYTVAGTLGSHYEFTDHGSLRVFNRDSTRHAPIFDLKDIRHCLKPNQRYTVTARVKLTKEGSGAEVIETSDCVASNTGCLDIRYEWMRAGETGVPSSWVYNEEPGYGFKYGEEASSHILHPKDSSSWDSQSRRI